MVTTKQDRFTRDDYRCLPEGFPAQLIDGQLIREPAPSYGHQRIVENLYLALRRFIPEQGRVVLSPIDVQIDRYNVLQPDLLVLAAPLPISATDVGVPLIVFEVSSPSTAFRDRHQKRRLYLGAGVREVWIIDAEATTILIYTRDECRRYGLDERALSTVTDGLAIEVRPILAAD